MILYNYKYIKSKLNIVDVIHNNLNESQFYRIVYM